VPNFQRPKTDSALVSDILISQTMANHLQLSANDNAALLFFDGEKMKRRAVHIAGIYQTGMEEFDGQIMLCDLALLQGVMGWDAAEVSGFEVSCRNFPQIPQLESLAIDISVALPMQYEALPITQIYPEIFDWLGLQHQNVTFILLLLTIVAIINMVSVVLILIIERTRTIGILRAMGLTAWRTQQIFLWNAFYLVLMGVILGNILGLGLLYSQSFFGWLRVDEQTYFIREVPVAWVWTQFAIVNLGVIGISTLCMLLPTAIISRILPVKAIRWR
jgi:lipoprotein-releasing system permease protein